MVMKSNQKLLLWTNAGLWKFELIFVHIFIAQLILLNFVSFEASFPHKITVPSYFHTCNADLEKWLTRTNSCLVSSSKAQMKSRGTFLIPEYLSQRWGRKYIFVDVTCFNATNIFVNWNYSRERFFWALLSHFKHCFELPGFSSHHLLSKEELFTEIVCTWCRVELKKVCVASAACT